MLKDFILCTELARIGGFTINNIAYTLKNYNLEEGIDFMKFGGITLFNKKSLKFPKYITKLMTQQEDKFTNLEKYIPWTVFNNILENQTTLIKHKFKRVKIDGKQFVEITDKQLRDIILDDSVTKSVVKNCEVPSLLKDKYILGYIKLNNKKSLTWY